jgi:hypothetical protein
MAVDIKKIFADIERATETETRRISEAAFKTIFLPMFQNQDSNPHGMVLMKWAQYVGSIFHKAYVVDEKNNILFTVPPVVKRDAIAELGRTDGDGRPLQNVAHMINTYNQMTNIGPIPAENYLNEQLTRRLSIMKGDQNYLDDLTAWNEIFKRYGVAPIKEVDGVTTKTDTKGIASQHDEIEPL